jgi:DNA-binding Xre family transcriptional regulator
VRDLITISREAHKERSDEHEPPQDRSKASGRDEYTAGQTEQTRGSPSRLMGCKGAPQNTICKLEGQQRGAYMMTVRRLCEALRVEPGDLICMDVIDAEKGR